MKALTLWRPWGNAIIYYGKDIENRVWAPPAGVIGQRIAIHNGLKLDPEGITTVLAMLRGDARAIGRDAAALAGPAGMIIGTVRVVGCARSSPSPWFTGPFGWVLADPRPLVTPLQCGGALRLWDVPEEIAAEIGDGVL